MEPEFHDGEWNNKNLILSCKSPTGLDVGLLCEVTSPFFNS